VTLTLDASVVLKWLLQDPEREAGTDRATKLMETVLKGEQPVLQPTHWIMEVGAVLARESPATATDDITMLQALELPAADEPLVLRRGVELAMELKQHLFDTFYHALALEAPDGVLVTADDRYLHAARGKGQIMHLMDWVYSPTA
jgi:predicted nucleic acid-binding protein